MKKPDIPYYQDYVSLNFYDYLKSERRDVSGIPELQEVGQSGGLESTESLSFLCELYDLVKSDLNTVLEQRIIDRKFIDQRTGACFELNRSLKIDFLDPAYETVIGQQDSTGRIVIGPKNNFYCKSSGGKAIAPIPKYLQGHHVTLFGPPDDPKLSINAMNAFHRKLKDEPAVVAELLKNSSCVPKWGADDEDSKTPLRKDLISAGQNLTGCFDKNISFTDPKTKKSYVLEEDCLALPIKRFPGLALPCAFLYYRGNPIPLHLYDFALHLFKNWHNPEALAFYVPKLENEEEARYIRLMIAHAERMIQTRHAEYKAGTIRLLIVLENPRAVFRLNEIIDELHPYFAGASLGWHDYLASTARLFKQDANYRIPVKADPDIVIKYIKASHNLLSEVVGSRGGIKIGGMYGILPSDTDLKSPSFQVTMKGFIKDVIIQLKRDLSGFWVAHPDFVRLGLALVEAWKLAKKGEGAKLEQMVTELLDKKYHQEIIRFIHGPDLQGLDITDPLYPRSLLVADIKESTFIANNDPEEIRYNVFQSLQYLTDWLTGNGCVALPAQIDGIPVRVMDDLATAERSRWEVWHELYHQRFSVEDFLRIAHEELHFIRKDLSDNKKIVQVKWDDREGGTGKWYPVAMNLMILLMTNPSPVEFASEVLLPFTIDSIRKAEDPWKLMTEIDPKKYAMSSYVTRFNYYFSLCGSQHFATAMAKNLVLDFKCAKILIKDFTLSDILEAASFHGNIGESKNTLDQIATQEQALVLNENAETRSELHTLGEQYLNKFKMKFLISAKGKSGKELLAALKGRLGNTQEQELANAKQALWEITKKRMMEFPLDELQAQFQASLAKHKVTGAAICLTTSEGTSQNLYFGEHTKGQAVTANTWFEMASLSKSVASCFALEYFRKEKISLKTSVNRLLSQTSSSFRIKPLDPQNPQWGDQVTLMDLMNHTALNLHYVNGVPANEVLPPIRNLLSGNESLNYPPVGAINPPGTKFQYSGGGFLVLEHLLEALNNQNIQQLTRGFLDQLGMKDFSFEQKSTKAIEYASGYQEDGSMVQDARRMFPALAAGAMGTATDISKFLVALTEAFHNPRVSGPISHDTAVQMLYGVDRGSQKFMGANMGLGVFTAEAGPNRFCLHQGANDGFRALFVHCYAGPDRGFGFVTLCNAELNGVLFISEVAQTLFSKLKIQGINTSAFKSGFVTSQIPQHEIVNVGYRKLIFSAFTPDLPEAILEKGPMDPLASYNLAVGGKILEVSNQRFARAENLLSPYLPTFDPKLFGKQGKIMDSWETVRHNQRLCDEMIFELKSPSDIRYVGISTQFHLGNQAQFISLQGRGDKTKNQWMEILPKISLQGHAYVAIQTTTDDLEFSAIRVLLYPDGGLTRLGLYNESLPDTEKSKFSPVAAMVSIPFASFDAQTSKPLTPKYNVTSENVQRNLKMASDGAKQSAEIDFASAAFGGKIIKASNEHYGPAVQVISPYPPLNMFDGLESARSRDKDHQEEVVIALGKNCRIHRLEIDFTYFVNNNPLEISIEALTEGEWVPLVKRRPAKAYAGNQLVFEIQNSQIFSEVRVITLPDGGMNRVRVFGRL
jgi:allantoicase/malate synthase/CubicO group peptidase (beta-lactamase class C family)